MRLKLELQNEITHYKCEILDLGRYIGTWEISVQERYRHASDKAAIAGFISCSVNNAGFT